MDSEPSPARGRARLLDALLRSSWVRWLRYSLTNSERHCVAAYEFGQFAKDLRARRPYLGLLAVAIHRVWNRWTNQWHHCVIDHRAEIGPGLTLMHRHGIIIGPSIIGRNCRVHQNVTIGQRIAGGDRGVPRIGDNVWIGPGATIVGTITIGDRVTISAGTVLSKDVPSGCLVGGNPGRVIVRDYDSSAFLEDPVSAANGASPR